VIEIIGAPQGHVSVISVFKGRLHSRPTTSKKGSTMIEVNHLTKRYGKTVAVDQVSFKVEPGKVTGFLGPNGAGKSTTMRMILGLDAPTSGQVRVDGKSYHELREPLRSVGALLDAKAIIGGRSAANHLKWLADSNGITRRRVSEVLDIAGLSDVAGRKVGTFSLGMNQRLGIAAALLGDPSTVMFDEPINGLDPEGIVWIRNLMKSLALEGRTVFLSSHLMSEMALTADHLIVIGRGSIIANASTDDFINRNTAPRIRVRALEQYELAEVLTQRGAVIERGSDDALVVTGLGAAAIGDAARIHDITLTELAPQGSTLEEAYFDLTKEVTDYNAGQLVDATKGA
jgi:ABC-2 type transport system ATP-binding protein